MRFGIIPTEGGSMFREALDEVVLAEELGFDSVWMEEHHGITGHYWPSPLVVLTAFGARTSRILLGTDVIVTPFYHPVRLAEDVAVIEELTGGRLILGAAIGYRPDEFALYDAEFERRGGQLEELIGLLRALWAGETVDHDGRHYRVKGRIEPVPAVPPAIWIGGWGPMTIRRAAELADAWVPGPTAGLPKLLELREAYDAALVAAGRDVAAVPRPITREVIIAPTDAQAEELAERHLMVNYRDEYGGGTWKHPLIGAEDTTRHDRLEEIGRDRFIIGSPETAIARIRRFQETLGIDHLICRLFFPGMPHDHIMSEIRLLAEEVMPAFR
ncbi:MAG: LLM class flavin-dependent oxidoreductase [Chloroflexi bacterium]|nr:LLM class flavin-dependent oxidoreductase [Chloroflexota bacterium]